MVKKKEEKKMNIENCSDALRSGNALSLGHIRYCCIGNIEQMNAFSLYYIKTYISAIF